MTKLKKVWEVTSVVLVVLIVLCAVFLMGSRLLGYQVYTILTGSMKPEYNPGDLVYVKQVDGRDFASISDPVELENAKQEKIQKIQSLIDKGTIGIGDPITFMLNETTLATHRIVGIDAENHKFLTKGDVNDTTETVHYLNLVGKVYFSIPKLGYVSNFIQNPPGMYISIAAGAVLIVLVFLPDFLKKKKPEEAAEQTADENTLAENEKLKAELETLKAQLEQKEE